MRLIDADELMEKAGRYKLDTRERIYELIRQAPTIDPVRHGTWNTIQGDIVVCSKCGWSAPVKITGCLLNRHTEPNRTNYCPNCGCRMTEGEEDGRE